MSGEASKRGVRRAVVGRVVSDKMDKTITVRQERLTKHPLYGKYVRRATTYKAHDEENKARIGDTVEIAFARPLSKTKRWRLVRVLRSDELAAMTGSADADGGEAR
jgi:small subunit ribosomal protein S17